MISRTILTISLGTALLSAADNHPLGHPDFRPSDSNPIGWQGDGTAYYPGANPVSAWSDGTINRKKFTYSHKGRKEQGWGSVRTDDRQRNILWRTKMPSFANSAPVIIGDRIYTLAEPASLICADLNSGTILWQDKADITTFVTKDPSEQQDLRDFIDAAYTIRGLTVGLMGNYGRLPALQNENQRQDWKRRFSKIRDIYKELSTDNRFKDKVKPFIEKAELWLTTIDGLSIPQSASDLKKYNKSVGAIGGATGWISRQYGFMPLSHWSGWCGWTYATPITDGKRIYVTFGQGQTVAWDLDGKRQWAKFIPLEKEGKNIPTWSRGIRTLISPLLADTVLIGQLRQKLVGYDKNSGHILWTQPKVKLTGGYRIGNYAMITLASGRQVLYTNAGQVVDPKTGKIVIETTFGTGGGEKTAASLVAKGDCVYLPGGGNNSSQTVAIQLQEKGGTISAKKLWTVSNGTGGHSPILAGDWLLRLGQRKGNVHNRLTGATHSTKAQPSWVSPTLGGRLLAYHRWQRSNNARPSKEWIIEFDIFKVSMTNGTLENLGKSYLSSHPIPPLPAFERWAPELSQLGWAIDPNGGMPNQFGFAPLVAHDDKWILRSCAELICIGPRYRGTAGDDKGLGARIAASKEASLIRQYIANSNAFYRFSAVTAAKQSPSLAKTMQTELHACIANDNYPEIRGPALDALLTNEPTHPILKQLVTSLNKQEIAGDPFATRHIVDTLRYSSKASQRLLVPLIQPKITDRSALTALAPIMRQVAREYPSFFAESIAPVFMHLHEQGRGAYLAMLALGGPKSIAALPMLKDLALGGNGTALRGVKAVDPTTFNAIGGTIASKIGVEFEKTGAVAGKNHLHRLRHSVERLSLLDPKHQKEAIAGMQSFANSSFPSQHCRDSAKAMIAKIKAGGL